MKNILTYLLFFLCCSVLSAQSEKENLLQQLSEAKADTGKVWLLHDVAFQYRMTNVDSMILYLQEALKLSEQLAFANGEIASLHELSLRYQFKGDKIKERALTLKALKLAEDTNTKDWLGKTYNHMGLIYYWELKYDSAYHAFVEAEKIERSLGKDYVLWESKLNFFHLFNAQGDYEKAEKHLEEAYQITKVKGIRMDIGYILVHRVKFYFATKTWDKYAAVVEEYLQFLNERSSNVQSNIHHKSLFNYTDEDPREIIKEIEIILPYHQKNNNTLSLVQTYRYLGSLKQQIGDYDGAIAVYKKAIDLAQKAGYRTSEAQFYNHIVETYEADNKLAAAFPYLKKYQHFVDSLNSIEVQKNLSELEVKYETVKKDEALAQQELALQKSTQARQIITLVAIAGSLLALVALWFLYFKNKTNRLLKSQKIVIEKALNEKEILLKEIHHRVKNNLQVISSLLNWQSKYIDDHKALKSMQEGRNRVQSMALIHQNLYQSENLTGVEVSDYIDKLGNSLFNSYNIRKNQIQFHSEVESLNLDVDTLIPLGLILNELLSNALKHAFPDGREGQIQVSLQKQEESLLLEVKDDGVGISNEKKEKSKDSFGYKLIEAFAEKLKAQLQIDNSYGTTVRLLIQNFKTV